MTGVIRRTRHEMGMSEQQLADILLVSRFEVSRLEQDDMLGILSVRVRDRILTSMRQASLIHLIDVVADPDQFAAMVAFNISM